MINIFQNRTCQLEKMAHEKAGKVFQLNSHVQLRQVIMCTPWVIRNRLSKTDCLVSDGQILT